MSISKLIEDSHKVWANIRVNDLIVDNNMNVEGNVIVGGNLTVNGNLTVDQVNGIPYPVPIEGFSAYLSLTGIAPIFPRVTTDIKNATYYWKQTSSYNTVNGYYTVPYTGIYELSFKYDHTNSLATTQSIGFRFSIVGFGPLTASSWSQQKKDVAAGTKSSSSGILLWKFTAGQQIVFQYVPNETGTQDIFVIMQLNYLGA